MIKIKNPKKLQVACFKMRDSSGYAAMFTFLVMASVLSVIIVVFTALAVKSLFMARAVRIDSRNLYALEGFIEDVVWRANDSQIADVEDGEELRIGDVFVAVTKVSEGGFDTYSFTSQTGERYFKKEILKLQNKKISEWNETQ